MGQHYAKSWHAPSHLIPIIHSWRESHYSSYTVENSEAQWSWVTHTGSPRQYVTEVGLEPRAFWCHSWHSLTSIWALVTSVSLKDDFYSEGPSGSVFSVVRWVRKNLGLFVPCHIGNAAKPCVLKWLIPLRWHQQAQPAWWVMGARWQALFLGSWILVPASFTGSVRVRKSQQLWTWVALTLGLVLSENAESPTLTCFPYLFTLFPGSSLALMPCK